MFSLEKYLSDGVDRIVSAITKSSLHNPKAGLFMIRQGVYSKKARKIREKAEKKGEHIPPFLIASITDHCNLHCSGCYARGQKGFCHDDETTGVMTEKNWDSVFFQAEQLGVQFILLAGGEPLMREDVVKTAANHNNIIFPLFTNGTMLKGRYIDLLRENRNLLPVISIEGKEKITDERRGTGIYKAVEEVMSQLDSSGIIFGVSVTVTKSNLDEVFSKAFVDELQSKGVKGVIYVEYVPVDEIGRDLAPNDDDREKMNRRLMELRTGESPMLLISFPGDEKASGGCLAAGRGFFHINPFGGAEPCPFSPYSDTSVKDVALRDALKSPLFVGLREDGSLTEEHIGGCTLFEQRNRVEKLLADGK